METKLAILIPVLRRPQNIAPLINSIKNNTPSDHRVLFITSPSDEKEIESLSKQDCHFIVMDKDYEGRGDYAKKINKGFNEVEAEWYFTGADDLKFHPGWFESAMFTYQVTQSCVIGTNDLGNPRVKAGQHSTHTLVLGEYIKDCGTIDESGKILHEGYHHNFCDDELVSTAKWRGAWTFARGSKVEHIHPLWKSIPVDDVYKSGRRFYNEDEKLFSQRKKLWP